jgi:hypothetical protein
MKKWLKRIRGAFGTALTWAIAWSGVGATFGLTGGNSDRGIAAAVVDGFIGWAILGFVGGAIFSVVLGIAEGRRGLHEVSLPRFAGLGAVGGLLLGMVLFAMYGTVAMGLVGTLLGAGSAAGSLALARRADDRELLEHGADVADIGLTDEEKHELLAR